MGFENAVQYRLYARNQLFNRYKSGEYSYEYAIQQTAQIKNPADRAATVQLLQTARDAKENNKKPMGLIRYIPEWSRGMLGRSVGYMGHQILFKSPKELYPYYIVFLLTGVMMIIKFFWSRENRRTLMAFVVVLFYASLLIWYVNYPSYIHFGADGIGLAGRYIFPVLMPICGLIAYYAIGFWPKKIQIIMAGLISGWFIYGDFIFFMNNVPSQWLIR
jgi:hypothetical protein